MKNIKTAILFLAIILFPFQSFASDDIRKITVTGKSEVVLDAHYAIIKVRLKEIRSEMSENHDALIKTISNFTEKLINVGMQNVDIKKSLIKQGREYSSNGRARVFTGYYSECFMDLYIKSIDNISNVYKELSNYEDLVIRSTEFKRNDEFDIRKAEFEKALIAAKSKAEHMAQILDARIGQVHSIQEISANNYATNRVYSNIASRESSTNQTGYGSINISVLVAVEFELE